jgi:eukaryotic-like serine/threonine-protein kinase
VDPHDEVLTRRIGQTIAGRWTLRRLIGTGGMAAIYAADSPEGQVAAIKLLYPEMGMRKDIRERFLREAAVMARIVHPGMVTIFEQGQSGDLAYLAMELLTGETVADRVRRLGRLQVSEVLAILDQVLDVLTLAHSMGVVHRDLKPENLFLTREERVKVLDFGLARLLDAGPDGFRTRTGAALGTLPYMAPEQALGRRDEVDARTDLFAVGATAFRLLTGRRIHEAPSEAELLMCMASAPAPQLVAVAPELSPELGAVVDRALAFAKLKRYPDASTMQSDVRALLAGQAPAYALECRDRDESVTKVDRAAATVSQPNSTRPLHAAAAAEGGSAPSGVPATAFDPAASPTEPNAEGLPNRNPSVPASRRILPATLAMPAPMRDAKTAVDSAPSAAQGASIPLAPMSDTLLERKRRRTLTIGLLLLLFMLGVAIAAGWYLFFPHGPATAKNPVSMPSTSRASSVENKLSELPAATENDSMHMRHPAHVMTPLEEPAQDRRSRRGASLQPPDPPNAATAKSSSPAATVTPSAAEHQASLLPSSPVTLPTAAAAPTAPIAEPISAVTPLLTPPPAANAVPPASAPNVVPTVPPPGHAASGKPKQHGHSRR